MASNPVMDNNPYFRPGAVTPNQQMPGYGNQYGAPVGVDEYAPTDFDNNAMYAAQIPTGRMTFSDAIEKIGVMLGVIVVVAVATAILLPVSLLPTVSIIASLTTLVVAFIAGRKEMISPAGALAYSALEGLALGSLTGFVDYLYPGIAFQAVLGTLVVAGVATLLHTSGKVRTSARGRRIVSVMLISAIVYGLVNLVMVLIFGKQHMDYISIGGMPLGVILGLVLIVAAGYSLISDLELIRYAEANGAPKEFAWTCSFGFVVTIVWIYVEVVRILFILANSRD